MAIDPISAGIGIAGLVGGKKAQKRQAKALKGQERLTRLLAGAVEEMLARARAFDPAQSTQEAVDFASSTTQNTLEKGLRNLGAKLRQGGATPGSDTEFRVRAQGFTDRATDPLRAFIAERKANEFFLKQQAFAQALGAPTGNILQSFGNMSQGGFDPSASLQLLGKGLGGLFGGGGTQNLIPQKFAKFFMGSGFGA